MLCFAPMPCGLSATVASQRWISCCLHYTGVHWGWWVCFA